ncbi:unnamed protein product [Chrysoparadoxa australica]
MRERLKQAASNSNSVASALGESISSTDKQILAAYTHKQDLLNQLGITDVLFDVLQLPQGACGDAALDLGIEMLANGNRKVQKKLYDLSTEDPSGYFFHRLRERFGKIRQDLQATRRFRIRSEYKQKIR